MTNYVGDFRPGDIVRVPFTTVAATGNPAQLSGAPSAAVYAMGSVMSAMVAGVSVIVNMGSFTGQNVAVIDTSQDTIAYAIGTDFAVTITSGIAGGTGGVVVTGYTVGHFSLNNRSIRNTTSIAQVGVNVVTVGGLGAVSSLALGNVNVVTVGGVVFATSTVAGNVNVVSIQGASAATSIATGGSVVNQILGAAVVTSAAQIGANVVTFAGNPTGPTNIDISTRDIIKGTTSNGSTTTLVTILSSDVPLTTASQFVGRVLNFRVDTATAALQGQSTVITGGLTSSGGQLQVTALTDAPARNDSWFIS